MSNNELSTIRHSLAHVMAAAVKSIWPDAKIAIGPDIDNGFYYDFDLEHRFNEDDFEKIEKEMKKIIKSDGRFAKENWSKDQAREFFKDEPYKLELIDGIEDETVGIYKLRDFVDLCKGPHVESSKQLPKSFKLDKIAGAYWRGDSSKPMLQRIYALAFETDEALEKYLVQREEAEKRDHRKIGPAMELFHFEPDFAPGAVFWHPKGWSMYRSLINYMREKQDAAGYKEVETPRVMDRALWETSGHWEKFGEHNYSGQTEDGKIFCIKPMNCPGHMLVFNKGIRSYKDLPLRMAEFGKVNRYEPSGALHGLMRVREFTQDDAHIFCTLDQMEQESLHCINFILDVYKDFGFENILIKLSTRPEKRIGSDEVWDKSEKILHDILKNNGYNYQINEGEGAFYGPKLEFVLTDAIGRHWQMGTVQLDMSLPERFDLNYIGEDGNKHRPVMLHRAILGSIERFMGIMIEHYAGKLPVWLAPTQVMLIPISDKYEAYAEKVLAELKEKMPELRIEKDYSSEKMQYRIREAQLKKIPYMIIVGEKEEEENKVSIRTRDNDQTNGIELDDFIKEITDKIKTKSLTI